MHLVSRYVHTWRESLTCQVSMLLFWVVSPCHHIQPSRWTQHVPLKRWYLPTSPHAAATQNINTDIFSDMRNPKSDVIYHLARKIKYFHLWLKNINILKHQTTIKIHYCSEVCKGDEHNPFWHSKEYMALGQVPCYSIRCCRSYQKTRKGVLLKCFQKPSASLKKSKIYLLKPKTIPWHYELKQRNDSSD
jgi:hypothetical protein